jgi:hypothetical protein
LQHPEQSKGNADLEEEQDRPTGFAPDAGPDERQKSHAAVPTGAPLSPDGLMLAAKSLFANSEKSKSLRAVMLWRPIL